MKKILFFTLILSVMFASCGKNRAKKDVTDQNYASTTDIVKQNGLNPAEFDGTIWSRDGKGEYSEYQYALRFNDNMVIFMRSNFVTGVTTGVQTMCVYDKEKPTFTTTEVIFVEGVTNADAQKYSNLNVNIEKNSGKITISGISKEFDGTYKRVIE